VGLHALFVHTLLAFTCWQAIAHPPQLFTLLAKVTSQPDFTLPSQSPKAVPQLGTQAPLVQVLVPFGARHVEPQPPQLALLDFRLASQPSSSGFPLQSAKFAAHLSSWQLLATHLPEALSAAYTVLQLSPFAPQPPQLLPLVLVFVSQSVPLPSQSAHGALQVFTLQTLFSHFTVALPMLHTLPQTPQLLVSLTMFVSQPSFSLPLQSAWLASHVPILHTESTQLGELLSTVHGEHAPQCSGSLVRSTSQPFFGSPSQSPKPAGQSLTPHLPCAQNAVPLPAAHSLPQAPQLRTSLSVFSSQPFLRSSSQSE